jgi:hypothetical protein
MSDPKFQEVNLTELQDEGVLLAANEAFFWRLGLALTWDHDPETGTASNLHIREWTWNDRHREIIELAPDDTVAAQRHARFKAWLNKRIDLLLPGERDGAIEMLYPEDV